MTLNTEQEYPITQTNGASASISLDQFMSVGRYDGISHTPSPARARKEAYVNFKEIAALVEAEPEKLLDEGKIKELFNSIGAFSAALSEAEGNIRNAQSGRVRNPEAAILANASQGRMVLDTVNVAASIMNQQKEMGNEYVQSVAGPQMIIKSMSKKIDKIAAKYPNRVGEAPIPEAIAVVDKPEKKAAASAGKVALKTPQVAGIQLSPEAAASIATAVTGLQQKPAGKFEAIGAERLALAAKQSGLSFQEKLALQAEPKSTSVATVFDR
ncbi:MAG: hypothetical protein P8P30_02035 [Rickettsiales bacterium]|nr:hypothetical protein [Rickettsiales bacterium]